MDKWLEYIIVMFYQAIKEAIQSFVGLSGLLVDLLFLGIGYWKREETWGRGLFYGALASIGRELASGVISDITARFRSPTPTTTATVVVPTTENVRWY